MNWEAVKAEWPNAAHSRFIKVQPHHWHVQEAGPEGAPLVLLLHGAGGSTHSFREMFRLIARDWRVVALDLPGQGFSKSGTRSRLGLDGMAEDIAALLAAEGLHPQVIIGHSAGCAIALRMALSGLPGLRAVVGLNGALGPFPGMSGWLFPMLAKVLALNPFTAFAFARTAGSANSVRKLIDSTGSRIDAEGIALYQKLVSDRAHVDGTLNMMAQWALEPLLEALPELDLPVLLMAGAQDGTVPARTSRDMAARMRDARYLEVPGDGHLMHEEHPAEVWAAIRDWLAERDISALSARVSV